MTARLCIAALASLALIIPDFSAAEAASQPNLFDKDNLVAWCIVPFDAARRGPEERAAMLEELGLKKFAHDWHEEHVPTFEDEILALRRHGIEFTACLFCVNLNGMTPGAAKVLPLGSGTEDLKILAMIRDSGYRGPIGILDHRPELDAKKSLRENLGGLKTLLEKLGDAGTPKSGPFPSGPQG